MIDPQTTAAAPAAELRDRLETHLRARDLSQTDAARELGQSVTKLNRYLRGNFQGDLETFEVAAEDYLHRAEIQAASPPVAEGLVNTRTLAVVHAALEQIIRLRDFGVIVGPAGAGKTAALEAFCLACPTALKITVTKWERTIYGVEQLLFEQFSARGAGRFRRKFDFVAHRLQAALKLVIVDQAHKLSASGYECLFDLHDKTGAPVVLVGNACLLTDIRGIDARTRERNEQLYTRIGRKTELSAQFKRETVERLVKQHLPKPGGDLLELAAKVCNGPGRIRALKKHLAMVPELRGGDIKTDADAFRAAHQLLVTDLNLD